MFVFFISGALFFIAETSKKRLPRGTVIRWFRKLKQKDKGKLHVSSQIPAGSSRFSHFARHCGHRGKIRPQGMAGAAEEGARRFDHLLFALPSRLELPPDRSRQDASAPQVRSAARTVRRGEGDRHQRAGLPLRRAQLPGVAGAPGVERVFGGGQRPEPASCRIHQALFQHPVPRPPLCADRRGREAVPRGERHFSRHHQPGPVLLFLVQAGNARSRTRPDEGG